MKLFMVEYQVQFRDGKELLAIKDKIVVPGKTVKGAQSQFLKTMQSGWGLLMPYSKEARLLAPLRDMGGEITVLSCTPVSK